MRDMSLYSTRWVCRNDGGWLLVGLIVVLSSVFVAMGALSVMLSEHKRVLSLRNNNTETVYLAQAGVMRALYDIRRMNVSSGGVELREYVVDAGSLAGTADDDVFILGGQAADFLLVNMKDSINFPQASLCGGYRDRMQGWTITNVLASATPPSGLPLTIDRMTITWSPSVGQRVLQIELSGSVLWSSCVGANMGEEINVTDTTVPSRRTWGGSGNRVWFSSNSMETVSWIDIAFRMSDGSLRMSHYEPTLNNRSADVTIRSIGEVRKGAFPFVTWRRLQADYRLSASALTSTGQIRSYRELNTINP